MVHKNKPHVTTENDGPSTLGFDYTSLVEGITGLFGGGGEVDVVGSDVDAIKAMESKFKTPQKTFSPDPAPAPTLSQVTNPSDQAMIASAIAAGAQGAPAAPGTPNNFTPVSPFDPLSDLLDLSSANLGDLLTGITEDSGRAFERLQTQAGARSAATQESIRAANERIASQLAAVPSDVSAPAAATGLSGGLAQSTLSEGAQAGSQGVAAMQAALGGFLEGSQARRGDAVQNFLTGLQGQSQVAVDRARSAGEFALAQQRALLAQQQALSQNDIAQQAANEELGATYLQALGLPPVPGFGIDEARAFVDDAKGLGLIGGDAEEPTRGALGQVFTEVGISDAAIPNLSALELQGTEFFGSLQSDPLRLSEAQQQGIVDADGAPTMKGIREWLDDNVIVVSDDDGRAGQWVSTKESGGSLEEQRGRPKKRLALTQQDYQRYLEAAASGVL